MKTWSPYKILNFSEPRFCKVGPALQFILFPCSLCTNALMLFYPFISNTPLPKVHTHMLSYSFHNVLNEGPRYEVHLDAHVNSFMFSNRIKNTNEN
jgi:hypothetical protein